MRSGAKTVKFLYTMYLTAAILLAGYFCYLGAWKRLSLVLLAALSLVVPALFALAFGVKLTPALESCTVLFLFCTGILGEVFDFYERISIWDNLLHLTSGFLFCAFGAGVARKAEEAARGEVSLGHLFSGVTFSLAAAGVWELLEYSSDSIFGTEMQKPTVYPTHLDTGLVDTVTDMAFGLVGTLLFAIWLSWGMHFHRGSAFTFLPDKPEEKKEEPV